MLRRRAVVMGLSSALLLGALVGCGRSSAAMPEPDAPPPADPGPPPPADPPASGPADPTPPAPPAPPGPGPTPAPPVPPPLPPLPPLTPLPQPTPTPGPKALSASASQSLNPFVKQLVGLGYALDASDLPQLKGQFLAVLSVPSQRLHAEDSPGMRQTHAMRKGTFGAQAPAYAAWLGQAKVAAAAPAKGWYVGRRALYQSVLRERLADYGSDEALAFYKRLADGRMVSYRADGRVEDLGLFPTTSPRDFVLVPTTLSR